MEIKDHKGKVASAEYFVAHLINPVDCIDVDASGVTWIGKDSRPSESCFLIVWCSIGQSAAGAKTLFARYFSEVPVLRRELAEAMKRENFSNVGIVPVSELAF